MATIYRCDGCDKDFKNKSGNITKVGIEYEARLPTEANELEELDLCNSCLSQFRRNVQRIREDRVASA